MREDGVRLRIVHDAKVMEPSQFLNVSDGTCTMGCADSVQRRIFADGRVARRGGSHADYDDSITD